MTRLQRQYKKSDVRHYRLMRQICRMTSDQARPGPKLCLCWRHHPRVRNLTWFPARALANTLGLVWP